MVNSFDTDVALDVGINAAILYKNIQYWCEKNRSNEQNFHDGYFWSYNSIKAFTEQFPYLSKKQIELALNTLEKKGYIKSGNYNKLTYDRTKWYADLKGEMEYTKKEKCISPVGEMEFPSEGNGFPPEGKPIPDNYQITTQINNNNREKEIVKKEIRFLPPTIEEVRAYCEERGNGIDPDRFIDYYASKGWMIGKNKMKDWKAAVRNWERKQQEKPAMAHSNQSNSLPFDDWI